MKNLLFLVVTFFSFFASHTTAQTSVKKAEPMYIGKKCPDCKELQKWTYDRVGFVETLTNPELNSWVKIDWSANIVTTTDGTEYKLEFTTNHLKQSQTYWYGGQKLTMYFDKNANYIGHEVE